jgi:ribose transport system substrate-binding protein
MVLHLIGPSVSSIVHLRTTGMQSTKPAGVQVRALAGDWSEQGGYNVVSRWLQLKTAADTPVTLVAAQNDDMAVGARRAFEEKTSGSQRQRWTGIPYIGCDCCPGAGETWVRKGLLTASIVNPPTAGIAVEMMARAIEGGSQPPERTVVEPVSHPALETLSPAPASA